MSDIIITHRHGLLGVYTRNGNAELAQRALIDISDDERTARELVEIVDELALRFGWQPRQLPTARREPLPAELAAAVAKTQTKPTRKYKRHREGRRAGHAEMHARRMAIVEHVRSHPDTTVPDITRALHPDTPFDVAVSGVRKSCEILVRERQLTRTMAPDNHAWLLRVVEHDEHSDEHDETSMS